MLLFLKIKLTHIQVVIKKKREARMTCF